MNIFGLPVGAGTPINPFNQDLNTTDSPTFNDLTVTGVLGVPDLTVNDLTVNGAATVYALAAEITEPVVDDFVELGGPAKRFKVFHVVDVPILNTSDAELHLGAGAGTFTQGLRAVALGNSAGNSDQGIESVGVGNFSGQTSQGDEATAMGQSAGKNMQGTRSLALGFEAGKSVQGTHCVAAGNLAGTLNQHDRTLLINAGTAALNSTANDQIRLAAGTTELSADANRAAYNGDPVVTSGYSATGTKTIIGTDPLASILPTGVGNTVLPASTMAVGDCYSLVLKGVTRTTTPNEDAVLTVKFNAEIGPVVVPEIDNSAGVGHPFRMEVFLTVKSLGVAGTIEACGCFTDVRVGDKLVHGSMARSSTVVDTTVDVTVDVFLLWFNPIATNEWDSNQAVFTNLFKA